MKTTTWLSLVEYLALIGAAVGSIASIASQQLAFTAAPVSFLLLLNVVNRRRFDKDVLEAADTSIAHLDRRLSHDLKQLDQRVQSLPSFADLASVRKTVQQRQDSALAQLQHSVSQRLSTLESRNAQIEQEATDLKSKHSQLTESIATISQSLSRLVGVNRVEGAEAAIAQLRQEIAQLQLQIKKISTHEQHGIPRAVQDELHQLHRRFSNLPQPFDATSLKQEVTELVKLVGELASRRDLAKLMAEVERIRQQQQSLDRTVAPQRSINMMMRKQMETLCSWATASNTAAIDLTTLQATVAQLEARIAQLPSGSNLADLNANLQTLDRQQNQLSQWLRRLPEMLDASAIQAQLKYFASRLESTETRLAALTDAMPDQFLIDPITNSRDLLQSALNQARSRIVVVFPYPDRTMLDAAMIQQFQTFLDRGGSLDLGWGHLNDLQRDEPTQALKPILSQLAHLKRNYPAQFRFKVLGTTENFLVCDSAFSILGIQSIAAVPNITIGLRTTNASVIQSLIDRFDHSVLPANETTIALLRKLRKPSPDAPELCLVREA